MSAPIAADREHLPTGVLVALTIATGATVGLAANFVPASVHSPVPQGPAGFVAGSLAVIALRSLSVRRVATTMCFVGGLMAVRFGELPIGTGPEATQSLTWLLVATTTMVLAATTSPRRVRRWRHPTTVRTGVAIGSLAAAAALAFGVPAGLTAGDGVADGDGSRFGPGTFGSPLVPADALDMTNRPRLSDELVLTVRTDEPGFWRVQTFDEWDGTTWTRSDLSLRSVGRRGAIRAGADDLAAAKGERRTDRFRVEAPFAGALPFGPSPVAVEASVPISQAVDGSLLPQRPLGRGATYVVESRTIDLDVATVRAAGGSEPPEQIMSTWASEPVATERTAALAAELTGGLDNSYDKVRAIERWLGDNTRYSIDAPLSPRGVDVVDHFLFETQLGWCEQVASSLTVLLRLSGVPARLATGFVPEGRDPVTGAYRVLERGAHAWTEVWFDGLGWVPFDPTAELELGSYTPPAGSVATLLVSAGVWVFLAIGLVAALGSLVWSWLAALVRRLRRARRVPDLGGATIVGGSPWAVETERRLDAVGVGAGRGRRDDETASTYGAALAEQTGAALDEVGRAVDRDRFGPEPLADDERRRVDELLDTVTTGRSP